MSNGTICILMPGDMGHGVSLALREHGYETITALDGRSDRTRGLAEAGKLTDVGTLDAAVKAADMVLSILPPTFAPDLATDVAAAMGRTGATPVYVDCNAISPGTAVKIGDTITEAGAAFIDCGIVGLAPNKSEDTRFYVSGKDTAPMQALDGKGFKVMSLGDTPGQASALKMAYAGLTKGSWTLWTAVLLTAERNGLLEPLIDELEHSQGPTLERMRSMVPFLPADSGRWVGEMEEIAKTFREADVSGSFHDGAAWMFALLTETPFADETRETLDRSRTLEDSVRAYAAALDKRTSQK